MITCLIIALMAAGLLLVGSGYGLVGIVCIGASIAIITSKSGQKSIDNFYAGGFLLLILGAVAGGVKAIFY